MRIHRGVTVAFALLLLVPTALHAVEQRRVRIDAGPRDLDGPSGPPLYQAKTPREGPAKSPPVTLAFYDFGTTACDTLGWTSVDQRNLAGFIFHLDNNGFFGNLTGGTSGRLVPLNGNGSLWCGLPNLPLDTNFCSYSSLPGYGNRWNETFESIAITRPAGLDIRLEYLIAYDTEAGYDKIFLEYKNGAGAWTKAILPSVGGDNYSGLGWPPIAEAVTIPNGDLPATSVQLRFRFTSDSGFSDQDGLFNSDGAVLIDDLKVMTSTFAVLNEQNFEVGSVGQGNTPDGVWLAKALGRGDFAGVVPGSSTLQQSPPLLSTDVNTTCLWTFFNGSPDDYACGGFPGEPVVPFGSEDEGFIENTVWSPWIPWEPVPGQTTHIRFDVYRDLPIDNLVFYEVLVRTRSDGGCPTQWQSGSYVYYGHPVDWHTHEQDVTTLVSTTAGVDEIQFAVGAVDLKASHFYLGSGTCHSNAPLIDNIEVFLDNTHSWVVHDLDLWQDTFPGDGTVTGTIRVDAASGDDVVRFRVSSPGIGMDFEGNGPAVFCHVKTLPGKAGSAVSGGQAWPEVASMSDADWTVIQCANGDEMNEYTVDLNDGLYSAGDIVHFYLSARDANGVTTYYSQFTGKVHAESEVRAYPMEFTGLPARALGGETTVLYVDYFSSRGAEPFFNSSFAEMSMTPDRYDVRAPSSFAGNGPGERLIDMDNQMFPYYDTIIWNTGDLENVPMSDNDWLLLAAFVDIYPGPQVGIYFSGNNFASHWANSTALGATYLRTAYCDFTVLTDSHRALGEPVSPTIMPEAGSPLTTTMIAYGGGSTPGQFDVIVPGQSSVAAMTYSGDAQLPAVITQSTVAVQSHTVNVILSGFSHHAIRDDQPTAPQDRTNHLFEVLNELTGVGNTPVGIDGGMPVSSSRLEQNQPNPFNPTTQIRYAVAKRGRVTVVVYNAEGRRVATLVDGVHEARTEAYSVQWDGHSDAGLPVASGVYFYKMTAPGFTETRKMVLLK